MYPLIKEPRPPIRFPQMNKVLCRQGRDIGQRLIDECPRYYADPANPSKFLKALSAEAWSNSNVDVGNQSPFGGIFSTGFDHAKTRRKS